MSYNRVNWQNEPSTDTPITAENLNKMDEELYNLENSNALADSILKNAGIDTSATVSNDSGIGQRRSFRIGPHVEGNYGAYCNVEYRCQSGVGDAILNPHDNPRVVFYICDAFDQGNITVSGDDNQGYGYHARIVGQYAPGSNPVNRILGTYGSALSVGGSIYSNQYGTVVLSYSDEYKESHKSIIYRAELWTTSP